MWTSLVVWVFTRMFIMWDDQKPQDDTVNGSAADQVQRVNCRVEKLGHLLGLLSIEELDCGNNATSNLFLQPHHDDFVELDDVARQVKRGLADVRICALQRHYDESLDL
jgi:hypothetical protein